MSDHENRDVGRDSGRDLQRDPARDDARDHERDPLRDGPRDIARDEKADHHTRRRALLDAAVLLAVPVAIVAVVASVVMGTLLMREMNARSSDRRTADYDACLASKQNRDAIRSAIALGDPTKLKPGDYGYSYAQAHPEEARLQSERIKRGETEAFRLFPEIRCVKGADRPTVTVPPSDPSG